MILVLIKILAMPVLVAAVAAVILLVLRAVACILVDLSGLGKH